MKRLFLCLFFYAVFFLTTPLIFSEPVYFDFETKSPILDTNSETEVTFYYRIGSLSEENFKVIPHSENGFVSVWDGNDKKWTTASGLWSESPQLSNNMRIKVAGINQGKTKIWFQVQDKNTGKVFDTLKKDIWGGNILSDYLKNLNENINNWNINDKMSQ
jgi:hypothetical protein